MCGLKYTAMEIMTLMVGTPSANRLEQLVVVFKKKLNERADPEESWHLLRHIIEEVRCRRHPCALRFFGVFKIDCIIRCSNE